MTERKRPSTSKIVAGIVLGVAAAALTTTGLVVGVAVKMARNAMRRRAATGTRT
jgi:hypothetical protein